MLNKKNLYLLALISFYATAMEQQVLQRPVFTTKVGNKRQDGYEKKGGEIVYTKLLMNNEQLFLQDTPFKNIYEKIQDNSRKSALAQYDSILTFSEDYEKLFYMMAAPFMFEDHILSNVPDNVKIDFLKIYIAQFNKRHDSQYLFEYIRFFNFIINRLSVDKESITSERKKELLKLVNPEALIIEDENQVILDDNVDFSSLHHYARDIQKNIDDTQRMAFVNAIKSDQQKTNLARIRAAFEAYKQLRDNITMFLIEKKVTNNAELYYVNIFLKIICNNFTERQMNQFQQNINTLKPQLKDAFAYILVNEKDNHYYKLIFKNDFAVENTYASVRLVEEIKQNSLEEFLKNSFPNDYDMHLNYKKMLLYERSKDPRDFDFLAHLEYIFKLIKDKKISQNVAYVMLAYCIDNISRNALQTEFDILKISELLNTHVQDIGIRKQLAGIMYAPLIGYHGSFKDNKVNLVYKVSSYVDDNGFYLWDILLKKLPIILGEYKDKKDELDKFLDSIVTHINVQKCDRIAVAEQIFKSISEILNDQMLYLVLKQNDEAKISFEKSPFAPVFMKVSNIEYRTVVANACNRFSNFNKYDLIVNAMHNPNQFADLDKEKSVILANIPDNLRREFLNIFVTEFKKKNENMFIFGYTMFFDYVINNLDSFIPGFTLKEKIDLASNINNNSISMTNDEKIVITDNTDFLSLCLTNKERGYDKFVDNRNAFLEAIKAKSEKDLKRIKVAFLGSNTLKKLLVRFLVDDNIQNDDGLTNINMFLKMIYIFTSDSERSNAYKDIQEIIEWIEKKLHVQNVVKAIPIKIDRGYYYTLKFEQSSKSPQSFDRSPFGQLVNKTNTLIVQEKDAVSQQKENPDLGQKNIKTQSDVSLLTSELTSEEKQKLNETPKKSVAGVVVQQTKDTSSLVNEQANEGASAVGKFFKAIGNSTKWFFSVLWYGLTYPFLQAWNYYLINVN